jgi:hypothetical protein
MLRIVALSLALAAAVWAGGRLLERMVLGADDAATRRRVEVDARNALDAMARSLRDMASSSTPPTTTSRPRGACSRPLIAH